MSNTYGPRIVSDGLTLRLDSANPRSYIGSGNTWRDISYNSNPCTLAGSPTFNSTNPTSFTFNGSNQKGDCGNNTSLQITVGTISAWFNPNGTTNTGYRGIIAKQYAWGLFLLDNVFITYDWGNAAARSTGVTPAPNRWHYGVMTFTDTSGSPSNNAILYLNGSASLTTTIKHSNQSVSVQIAEANSSQYFNGKIAEASVYNRVLTADEVRQNYNALKGRFGL